MSELTHHYETSALVQAPVEEVFTYVDDPTRLSSHMSESSWMMGGSRMRIELDDNRGQRVGSRIRMSGRIFGRRLSLEEVVTEHNFPHRKVWETTGTPNLMVIGRYRMGFEVAPQGNGALLRVHIDYALPEGAPARWFGYLLGRRYARWCARRMVNDAVKHFALLSREQPSISSSSPQRRVR
jgi:Polyketide cyclase / dehydrase and lipid transport